MSSTSTPTVRRRVHIPPAVRNWVFGGLALAWYAVTTFGPLGLPNFAVVVVLGVLVMLSVEPDARSPTRGVTPYPAEPRPGALGGGRASSRSPVGMNLLLGRIPIEAGQPSSPRSPRSAWPFRAWPRPGSSPRRCSDTAS